MVKVTVNGKTIAESNETIIVENNHYFPPKSVDKSLFTDSKTRCDPPPFCYVARLTLSTSGHTALFALGKGSPSLTPPPSDKLISQHPPQDRRVLRRHNRRQTHPRHRVVLPRTQRKGKQHQELRRILQGMFTPLSPPFPKHPVTADHSRPLTLVLRPAPIEQGSN